MNKTTMRRLFVLLIAFMLVSLGCGGAPAGGRQEAATESSNAIAVQAQEFSFTLDATQAKAGQVTFTVQNTGTMVHDFAIRGNGLQEATTQIEPGSSATLTVTLEPGTYTYICTIPGHEQLGMRGTFTVTGV